MDVKQQCNKATSLIILGVQMFNRILRYSSNQITEPQIRWGVEDKSKIFFLVSRRDGSVEGPQCMLL